MHTIEIIRAIFHGVDFYWRKLFVFLLAVFFVLLGIFLWHNQGFSKADFAFSNDPKFTTEGERRMQIKVDENGKVLIDGKDSSGNLKIYQNYYEVRILAIDNPGTYIANFYAAMELPKSIDQEDLDRIVHMYAIHGVGSYKYYLSGNRTIVYEASDISSFATLTIAANLPKDMLTPSWGKRLVFNIANLSPKKYLYVAISLPAITLILMIFMILKRRKDQVFNFGKKPLTDLPHDVPPAVCGVLIDGQVGGRELAATIIDLALRGYIYITKKGNDFTFGKRKSMQVEESSELRPFERKLLQKIFERENYKSTREDVEMRVGRHIFSRKIAQVYLEMYDEATKEGYFINNPASVHKRWKYVGIALFFLGLLGFIHTASFFPDPKFPLIFWAGEIAAAITMVRFSGLMPARSAKGTDIMKKWLAFRNYLKSHEPIEKGSNLEQKYTKFLPYAIVLGVEPEWTRRFMNEEFTKPEWYESIEPTSTLENFSGGLLPLISFTGDILAKSHEPNVE